MNNNTNNLEEYLKTFSDLSQQVLNRFESEIENVKLNSNFIQVLYDKKNIELDKLFKIINSYYPNLNDQPLFHNGNVSSYPENINHFLLNVELIKIEKKFDEKILSFAEKIKLNF